MPEITYLPSHCLPAYTICRQVLAAVCIFSFLFYSLSLTRPAEVNTHVGIAYTTFHLAVHVHV